MAFTSELRAGESLIGDVTARFGDSAGLRLVLSSQRARWPGTKAFALTDAVIVKEVAIADLERVSWKRPSALALFGVAAVLFLVGLIWSFGDGLRIGMPTAMVLISPVYPLLGRRKRVLRIEGRDGTSLKWTSPVVFGGAAAEQLASIEASLEAFTNAAGVKLER
jgi:hypothetical protein